MDGWRKASKLRGQPEPRPRGRSMPGSFRKQEARMLSGVIGGMKGNLGPHGSRQVFLSVLGPEVYCWTWTLILRK